MPLLLSMSFVAGTVFSEARSSRGLALPRSRTTKRVLLLGGFTWQQFTRVSNICTTATHTHVNIPVAAPCQHDPCASQRSTRRIPQVQLLAVQAQHSSLVAAATLLKQPQ
jgi:hypothetical protein